MHNSCYYNISKLPKSREVDRKAEAITPERNYDRKFLIYAKQIRNLSMEQERGNKDMKAQITKVIL
jgi:hypothetical protein